MQVAQNNLEDNRIRFCVRVGDTELLTCHAFYYSKKIHTFYYDDETLYFVFLGTTLAF